MLKWRAVVVSWRPVADRYLPPAASQRRPDRPTERAGGTHSPVPGARDPRASSRPSGTKSQLSHQAKAVPLLRLKGKEARASPRTQ